MTFRVGMLGMGRIASGFDTPEGPHSYTHLKGILADSRLSLVAVADQNGPHAAAELDRFGLDAEVVEPSALLSMDLDIVCIATPDGTHLDYAEAALTGSARLILVEKPLEADASRRRRLMDTASTSGKSIAIHHLRRWIPDLGDWMSEAASGGFGRPISAITAYTRGFRHNGVHALDLVAACLGGDVVETTTIAEPIHDLSPSDATRSLHVALKVGDAIVPFILIGVDGRIQTTFDLDIRFERARIRVFDENGVRAILSRTEGATPPGFAAELTQVSAYHDQPAHLPQLVWANLADHLEHGRRLACSGNDAMAAYDFADAILARVSQ